MANEDQFIRTELRYSDEAERKLILDEIDLSGGKNSTEYDGMIEVDLPLTSLDVLKKKHILMDFPFDKPVLKKDTELELFDIPVIEVKEETAATKQWIGEFKRKAKRAYIDPKKNTYHKRSSRAEPDLDSPSGGGGEVKPLTGGNEDDGDLEFIKTPAADADTSTQTEELYAVVLNGPLDQKGRELLLTQSINLTSLHDGKNEYAYKAFLSPAQFTYLSGLPMVKSVTRYELESKLSRHMIEELSGPGSELESMVTNKLFDIAVSEEQHLEKVIAIIDSSGEAKIKDTGLNVVRIETNPESTLLAVLADCPYVIAMSLYEPPTLFCDVSRKTIGLSYAQTDNAYWGESETVGVIDSGIDQTHSDLKTHITAAMQYGAGNVNDQFGHGTHVAGIICGDGTASNGKITGMAPKAAVVSLGIVDASGKLDLPVDIGKLLKLVAEKGAKIINLSLGDKVSGEYHLGSLGVDKYIYENPEILVVVAAGNEGNAIKGKLMYKTIGSPATAKNVLTVGASTGRRTTPVINQTWGDRKPANFPKAPMNSVHLISPDEDLPSLASSTGPTDFDSIKPEVVAPGTYILAAKASASNVSTSSSEFFDNNYTFKTGTSMAAPVVSGIAALVREYLRKDHTCNNPSSSLLKAIIIGSTHKINNNRKPPEDDTLSKVGFPDFDQGFGMVDLSKLLNEKSVQLFFADIYNTDPKALESRMPFGGSTKSYREYVVEVIDNSQDLSVTLTWIDPPAKGVQNNLQLSVKTPTNDWKLGNMEHTYKKDADFDTLVDMKPLDKYNNTEKVLINAPAPGRYLIKISAQNTLSKQGYSLAIMGNIKDFKER